MSTESANSAIQRNQVDLAGFVDWSGVECLNQNSSHSVPNALKQGYRDDDGLHLESDADEQLLLYIPFTQVVKLYAIDIKGPEDDGPKTVKLFSNKEHMGFSNVNDYPPSDTATLTPENLKGKPVILKYVKFQNVRRLVLKLQKFRKLSCTGQQTGSINCTKREWPLPVARMNMPCKNHNDEDDGMNDPDYAKFLKSAKAVKDCYISENVTVVRNYYKLDFVKKVRGVETITYEVEELSSDIRFQGSGPKTCRKSADCDRGGSLKTPSRGWGESEFGFMDHSYKTLLDVVELVGESLVLKTNGGLVEFEKQSSTDPLYRADSDSCKRKNSMSHQQGKIKVTGLHHVLGGSSTKRRKVYSEGQNYRTKLRSNILNVGEALFTARKEKENTSQHIAHVTSGFVQELNLEVNRSSAPKSKGRNHIACEIVEQDFKLFLDGAILREGLLVYKMYDGEEIVLEEDSDSSSIIVTDNADALTDGKSNPFVTTKHYYSLKRSKRNSDFRRMLIKTLRKSYDSREHKKLLREASRRKPVVYHRELRSRAYYPVVEVLGKSYFDHHRGLEGRFNSVRKDHRKGLNLLRGFFYWLKNLNQEGSFKPWTDKVCLQIMPRE